MFDGIVKNLKFLGADGQILTAGKSGKVPPGQLNGTATGNVSEAFRYFYHPDLPIAIGMGSTSYVTDASGEVYQHLEYFAFGETFVEEHSNTDRTPYLFNGKELDEETGLYYYGARYYDARTSVWQSVDPKAEKYPSISSYAYVANNPLIAIDPTGEYIVIVIFKGGKPVEHRVDLQKGYNLKEGDKGYNKFTANVYKTLNYLNEAGVAGDLVKLANDTENTVKVTESNETRYDNQSQTILFNPEEAAVNEDGSVSSPALQFLHEGDHASRDVYDTEGFNKDADYYKSNSPEYKQYRSPLEKKTIENVEAPAAEQLNKHYGTKEGIRKSHGSRGSYTTTGPTTHEPKNDAAAKKRDKLTKVGVD